MSSKFPSILLWLGETMQAWSISSVLCQYLWFKGQNQLCSNLSVPLHREQMWATDMEFPMISCRDVQVVAVTPASAWNIGFHVVPLSLTYTGAVIFVTGHQWPVAFAGTPVITPSYLNVTHSYDMLQNETLEHDGTDALSTEVRPLSTTVQVWARQYDPCLRWRDYWPDA